MSDLDMTNFIKPKSNQLNYDDLVAGDITITIRDVKRHSAEQPVAIYYDGDNGKPWLPCKSMMRVLVAIWGSRATDYVGRSLTLWGDPTVKWAGAEVGGIRIRAMEGLKDVRVMPLTASKNSRKAFTVLPLKVAKKDSQAFSPPPADNLVGEVEAAGTITTAPEFNLEAETQAFRNIVGNKLQKGLYKNREELDSDVSAATDSGVMAYYKQTYPDKYKIFCDKIDETIEKLTLTQE